MKIPDIEDYEQAKPDVSFPKISNHDEDGQNDEDETMLNVDEEIQAKKGLHKDKAPMDNIDATNPPAGIIKELRTSLNVTNTPLTEEELDNMNKNKLVEYLKAMMSAQANSTEKGSSSSTTPGSHSTGEPADQLLQ